MFFRCLLVGDFELERSDLGFEASEFGFESSEFLLEGSFGGGGGGFVEVDASDGAGDEGVVLSREVGELKK